MPLRWCSAAMLLLLLASLALAPLRAAGAVPGVNATHIVVGQTAPMDGGSAEYGTHMAAGLQLAFAEANAAGGVQGRNLTLLTLDDGYIFANALKNFQVLRNASLLLAGVCGSAINAGLLPSVTAVGIPSVGPWTGASATRSPFNELVVNVRASYADETVVHAMLLVQRLRVHRIACFYQNDAFGLSVLNGITTALGYVGLQLVATGWYATGSIDISAALEAIAGAPQPVQAVVMGSLETTNVNFIRAFRQDNRTDPNCAFLLISVGATSTFASKVETQYWPNLYFTQVMPPLDMNLGLVSDFRNAYGLYQSFAFAADGLVVEGYVIGRLVAQVLRGIVGEVTRRAFLDELYNTRLFAFGGLLAGLYGRNYSGCETAVCNSNIGLRAVFLATLQPATGAMHYNSTLGYYTFPIIELSFPVTKIVRPLLLGQLLPTDDPVWLQAAEAIGAQLQSAFAVLNAAGGVDGRPVQLLQRYYAGDPAPAAAAFVDRYSLLALVGSVVNCSGSLRPYAAAQIGTYQT
eukprot:EG_transcript_9783